jgi:hypothetical protein
VCCRGLSTTSIAAHEATDSWAAVGTADGKIFYLALAAGTPARHLVRLIDDDGDGVGSTVDLNATATLWVPPTGGDAQRPTNIKLTDVDNFGDPAAVQLVFDGDTLLLTWQGSIPGLRHLAGSYDAGQNTFTLSASLDAGDARVGDTVQFLLDDAPAACTSDVRAAITSLADPVLTLAPLSSTDAGCVASASAVHLAVEAGAAFVAEDGRGAFLGRLRLDDVIAAETALNLPGATLTMQASAAGLPLRGSRLAVPLVPHITTLGMNLSSATLTSGGLGFGIQALVPTAFVGGFMQIPGVDSGTHVAARRMALANGSADGSGRNAVFVFDEAETDSSRVFGVR